MVGWTDIPADLSDTGAIARLGAYLPDDALVVSSDLSRAIATADAIQGARPRLAHIADLREINFGDWEMRRFADIEAEDPDRLKAYWETPGDVRPPGGETWNQMRARVDSAVDRLVAAHKGRNLVIVAHFGAILGQVQRAGGLTAKAAFSQPIDNLSVTEITRSDAGWHTGRINHTP